MAKEDKIEKDYAALNVAIERLAQKEIKNIQQETNLLKDEVEKTGEAIENSINKTLMKASKKKS